MLRNLNEYKYFIFKCNIPNIYCIFTDVEIADGWLSFFSGSSASPVCVLNFNATNTSMTTDKLNDRVDRIHIGDNSNKEVLYAYRD